MSFDYSEFQAYRNNFAKFTKEFDTWLHKFLLNEGMRFIAEVKPRTPVDTGDLRNHWKLDGITRHGDTLRVWFVNSMYYATFVEYGHAKPYKSGAQPGSADWVEGYFMMTVSLDIIQRNMPARFNNQFKAFVEALEVS
jgi:hypothetical protein